MKSWKNREYCLFLRCCLGPLQKRPIWFHGQYSPPGSYQCLLRGCHTEKCHQFLDNLPVFMYVKITECFMFYKTEERMFMGPISFVTLTLLPESQMGSSLKNTHSFQVFVYLLDGSKVSRLIYKRERKKKERKKKGPYSLHYDLQSFLHHSC